MARPILSIKKPQKPAPNRRKAGDLELRRSLFGLVGKPSEGKARCR